MNKLISINKILLSEAEGILSVNAGGTGQDNVTALLTDINAVPLNSKNKPMGVAGLDDTNNISPSIVNIDNGQITPTIVTGPTSMTVGTTMNFPIVNYSPLDTYTITTTDGTATLVGGAVRLVNPVNVGTTIVTVNGMKYPINITQAVSVATPTVTNPSSGTSTDTFRTFTSSAFSTLNGTDTHQSSDWQISTNSSFTTIVQSSIDSSSNKTSWSVTGLARGTTYYVRVRHKGAASGYSQWSNGIAILVVALSTPNITSPANASTIPTSTTFVGSAFATLLGTDTHQSSDWQISTNSSFTSIVQSVTNSTSYKTSWSVSGLSGSTTYYVRVRYNGVLGGSSGWASTRTYLTQATLTINKPFLVDMDTTNVSSGTVSVTMTISNYSASQNGTQTKLRLQVADNSAFTVGVRTADILVSTSATTGNFNFVGSLGTTKYFRAQYIGNAGYGEVFSPWSDTSWFVTDKPFISSPASGTTLPWESYTNFVFGAFSSHAVEGTRSLTNSKDTHYSSDFQLSKNTSFTNIVIQSVDEKNTKTSILAYIGAVNGLTPNTTYYGRIRYKGSVAGYSTWSNTVVYTTGS